MTLASYATLKYLLLIMLLVCNYAYHYGLELHSLLAIKDYTNKLSELILFNFKNKLLQSQLTFYF